MKATLILTVAAILSLAGARYSQALDPPGSSPQGAEADMSRARAHLAEADESGISAGAKVLSPTGELIGAVKDIVPSPQDGRPEYVLIATSTGNTAAPYSALVSTMQNGHIVLNRSRLEHSPTVKDQQLLDRSDMAWKKQADQYWHAPY
jgi:hypothetical protein